MTETAPTRGRDRRRDEALPGAGIHTPASSVDRCPLPIQDGRFPVRQDLQPPGIHCVQDALLDGLHVDIARRADAGVPEAPCESLSVSWC